MPEPFVIPAASRVILMDKTQGSPLKRSESCLWFLFINSLSVLPVGMVFSLAGWADPTHSMNESQQKNDSRPGERERVTLTLEDTPHRPKKKFWNEIFWTSLHN